MGADDEDDEGAKTLKREDEPSPPGLEAMLAANLRGELHELGPGMIIDGKWELRALLGEGSFGKVYEAWHVKLGHQAAIKVLAGEKAGPKAKQRFLEEAQLMAGLSSEHLIRATDYGELPDGSPYFVMDLVKGKSLRHWLRERLPTWRAVEIGEQIVAGLVEVHRRGVVHGDIKPENVVIGEDDDKARLLDFGLAQTSADEPEGLGGTPPYMAPEMLLDKAPATVRTDVYAVGVVLYEMLTGRLPRGHLGMGKTKIREEWENRRRADPVLMHCKEVPEAQREALETLDKLVMEALARDPTARPKSAVPMLEELRRLRKRLSPEAIASTLTAESGAVRATTETRTTQPIDTKEGEGWATPRRVSGAVGVVALVGLLAWWAWPTGGGEAVPKSGGAAQEVKRAASDVPASAAQEIDEPFGEEEIRAAREGILIVVPEDATEAVMTGYDALRGALGCDRPRVEGTLAVLCRRVPAAVSTDAVMELAERAQARMVVLVGYGKAEEIEVRSTTHDRGNALLAKLDGLELPKDPKAMKQVAPVLKAVVGAHVAAGATGATQAEIPAFDWKTVGARWGVVAEWLRVQQGHFAPEDIERRKELARELEGQLAAAGERGVEDGTAFHRDLAVLVWATSLSCVGSERMLDELSDGDERASGIRVAALMERVGCLLEGEDARAHEEQAEVLLAQALAASGDHPCVSVEAIGAVSWIDALRGIDAGWEAHAKRLPGLQACDPSQWSHEHAVRGDSLVFRGEWCRAAEAYALAYEALGTNAAAVVAWPEYDWKCKPGVDEARPAVKDALRDALASGRFARPQERVSIAFMRWWLTRDPADAQRVLDEHVKVRDGEPAVMEGTASDLEEEICKGKKGDACSLRILARPKRAGDAEQLRRGLGLG